LGRARLTKHLFEDFYTTAAVEANADNLKNREV